MDVTVQDELALIAFWTISIRWFFIMMNLPLFENKSISLAHQLLISLIFTYAFFEESKAFVLNDIAIIGKENFIFLGIFNALVGMGLGMFVKSFMEVFNSAANIITQQIGFGAVKYFDPNFSYQIGPLEKLLSYTILMMILFSGAMLPMFKGIIISFQTINLSSLGKLATMPEYFLLMFKNIFSAAILLSSPLLIISLVISLVMGLMSRVVPQMNVLMVSFIVNIGLGLIVFLMVSTEFFHVSFKIYTDMLGEWLRFIS